MKSGDPRKDGQLERQFRALLGLGVAAATFLVAAMDRLRPRTWVIGLSLTALVIVAGLFVTAQGVPSPIRPTPSPAVAGASPSIVTPLSTAEIVSIDAAGNTTCVLLMDGTVECWGYPFGSFVPGDKPQIQPPTVVPQISKAKDLSLGPDYACAILDGGAVHCWGGRGPGRTEPDGATAEWTVAGVANATAVSAGDTHACALIAGGTIECWASTGGNYLGDGSATAGDVPVTVTGISTAKSVSAGSRQTCAVLANGEVECWGGNQSGEIGDGSKTDAPLPVKVPGITKAIAVIAASGFSCALLTDGHVQCWGQNSHGGIGDGTRRYTLTPSTVAGVSTATALFGGGETMCAGLADQGLQCWGGNDGRKLGSGSHGHVFVPVRVQGLPIVVAVGIGASHICALIPPRRVECLGDNRQGQFGNDVVDSSVDPTVVLAYSEPGVIGGPVPTDEPTPSPVALPRSVSPPIGLDAGNNHTCAVLANGSIRCWGANGEGQLGDGTKADSWVPKEVPGIDDAQVVSAGGDHTCVIRAGLAVRCWGSNAHGELGGSSTTKDIPGLKVKAVSAAQDYTCAITVEGAVECWGGNEYGQLGVGDTTARAVPTTVSVTAKAIEIDTGPTHACAALVSGEVECWGSNEFQALGDGTSFNSTRPVKVHEMTTAVDVVAGSDFSCALLANGEVQCWGTSDQGHLGFGQDRSAVPMNVEGIYAATAITGTANGTCVAVGTAEPLARSLFCWGNNESWQLAYVDDFLFATPTEIRIPILTGAVAMGSNHSCAIIEIDIVMCWGLNKSGQLGDGTTNPYPSLVDVAGFGHRNQ